MEFADVIIVGGGVSGLSAAKTLGGKVNYVLVEAQHYLGGRILTVDAGPNISIDLGAQYIHGDKNNSVYNICKELGILLSDDDDASSSDSDSDDESLVVTSDGKRIDGEVMEKAEKIRDRVLEHAEEKYEDKQPSKPVAYTDFIPRELQKQLASSSIPRDLVEPIVDYYLKMEMMETGCGSLSDLNLVEFVGYEDLKGNYENDLKNGGYRPFIGHLKSFIPNDNRIRLNCEVTRVRFLADQGVLSVEINNIAEHRVMQMRCNHMIWTTSLGFLKKNFQRIFADEPGIIQQKQSAIANMGFGTVNKVVMIYKKNFWGKEFSSIVLLHTQGSETFQPSPWLRERLLAERVDPEIFNEIVRTVFHFDVLPSTKEPILICWFAGPAAIMIEALSDPLAGQICHEVLCSYLGESFEKNPPVQILKSGWNSNRFICGAYTHYPLNSSKEDCKRLRAPYAPDGVPRILFAGEATHEGYYSTVNAALETGMSAGKKLLSIMD